MSDQNKLKDEFRVYVRETLGPPAKPYSLEEAFEKALNNMDRVDRKPLTGEETENLTASLRDEFGSSDGSRWDY